MLVNYRAPAVLPNGERPYTSYEVRHIINSELQLLNDEKPDVDPAAFKDKIVFVGLTASGLVDIFQSPFDSKNQGRMPGVQMHASVADSIISNRFIRPAGLRLEAWQPRLPARSWWACWRPSSHSTAPRRRRSW